MKSFLCILQATTKPNKRCFLGYNSAVPWGSGSNYLEFWYSGGLAASSAEWTTEHLLLYWWQCKWPNRYLVGAIIICVVTVDIHTVVYLWDLSDDHNMATTITVPLVYCHKYECPTCSKKPRHLENFKLIHPLFSSFAQIGMVSTYHKKQWSP